MARALCSTFLLTRAAPSPTLLPVAALPCGLVGASCSDVAGVWNMTSNANVFFRGGNNGARLTLRSVEGQHCVLDGGGDFEAA